MTTQETWSLSGALLDLAACGEKDIVAEILDVFTTDTEKKVESLPSLLVDLDFGGIARIAHSLKGAARQIGLEDLASVAEKLERGALDTNHDSVTLQATLLSHRWNEAKQAVESVRATL